MKSKHLQIRIHGNLMSLTVYTTLCLFGLVYGLIATPIAFSQVVPHNVLERCYGGTGGDILHSITKVSDGGIVVVGNTSSNDGDLGSIVKRPYGGLWVMKLNEVGEIQWQQSLGGSTGASADCVIETSDHGFLITGSTTSHDGDVVAPSTNVDCGWVVKLSSTGELEWSRAVHVGTPCCGLLHSAAQLRNGSYIVVGEANGEYEGFRP